jgi:hypothetical protein
MDEHQVPGLTATEMLAKSLRVWGSRAGMFVMIMGIPIVALLIVSVFTVYVVVPSHADGEPLRQTWLSITPAKKIVFALVFLMSIAAFFRALAASAFAAEEILQRREIGTLKAFRSVHRPQLRLFWLLMVLSVFSGPLSLLTFPILLFFAAPALPVAVLESQKAMAALKRGDWLSKGRRGRISLVVLIWVVGVFVAAYGVLVVGSRMQDAYGRAWFMKVIPLLMYWIVFLIPQWAMVALTVNYWDLRRREGVGIAGLLDSGAGGVGPVQSN